MRLSTLLIGLILFQFCIGLISAVANGAEFDYIVVGSGPGGGILAANLARRGFSVLMLESGGDDAAVEKANIFPINFGPASVNPATSWDFYVKHYDNETQQKLDSKYVADKGGILYPRASTLGGCFIHNAELLLYPQNQDWDYIATLTGDKTWKSANMRKYWERIENNLYTNIPPPFETALLEQESIGYQGWQYVSRTDWGPYEAVDPQLNATRGRWARQSGLSFLPNQDPNRFDNVGKEGLFLKPIAVRSGLRSTHYNYMKDTEAQFSNFHISLNSLATKIIMKGNKAVGVNYLVGKSLYKADQQYNKTNVNKAKKNPKKAFARKEVIISGGSYNTPQLLMLSGIGPKKQLTKFGIPVRVQNKYIGTNLQDRYEVAINMEMKNVWQFFTTCTFTFDSSDPCYVKYLTDRGSASIYSSNAVIISSAHKSAYANSLTDAPPDLVVFEATAFFDGYKPNYPTLNAALTPNNAVVLPLMAHTINNAGTVTLTSTDPTDMPDIRFRYFEEGSDTEGHDLAKSVEAVNFIREKLNSDAAFLNYTVGERGPMANYTGANTATGIRNEAWGHHACCTAPIGTAIDSKFRVIGAQNLRVVDASVFPKIPGYFINVPVMMISEKATDAILGL